MECTKKRKWAKWANLKRDKNFTEHGMLSSFGLHVRQAFFLVRSSGHQTNELFTIFSFFFWGGGVGDRNLKENPWFML